MNNNTVKLKAYEVARDFYLVACDKADALQIIRRFGINAKAKTLEVENGKRSFYGLNTKTKELIPLRFLTIFFGGHEGLEIGHEQVIFVSLDEYHIVEWNFDDWFEKPDFF